MNESKLRVLIVEDEALLSLYLQECIEDAGHSVVGIAATSREAIDLAVQARPDIAFVDINLLDGNTGIEVARRIRERCETLVVFMTANQKLIPGDFAGAAGLVGKPYSQSGLLAALGYIETCMRKRIAADKPPSSLVLSKAYRDLWRVPP